MPRIRDYKAARYALESAISTLIWRARDFKGDGSGGTSHAELLAAGREYGRALNRVEHMRGKR